MSTFNAPSNQVALTKARAEALNTLEAAIIAAFALLPNETRLRLGTWTYAVDTGTVANTYVVAMPQTATAYVDGMAVAFSPAHSNTGASTINVDGLGAKSIRQYNGSVLNANDIILGAPVELRYSASSGFFHRTGTGPAGATGATGATGSISTIPSGSIANPGAAFTAEPTTGWSLPGAGYFAVSVQGVQAAALTAPSRSAFFGVGAGPSLFVSVDNTFGGYTAGTLCATGNRNTATGSLSFSANASGSDNTAYGYNSLAATLNVDANTAYGSRSMQGNTTGVGNTAIGYLAGETTTAANKNTTGSLNTWLGYDAGPGVVSATSLSNATGIGNAARNTKSNQVVLGDGNVIEWVPGADGVTALGSTTRHFKNLYADYTITATVGAVTINKMAGNAIVANGATSVTVTNNRATVNSLVFITYNGPNFVNPPYVVKAAGSFTINIPGAGVIGNQELQWLLINTD